MITETPRRARRGLRTGVIRAVEHVTPMLIRLRIGGDELAGFSVDRPGQWVRMQVPAPDRDEPVGRAYTVRRHDPDTAEIDLDFVLHGEGPAAQWAANAAVGDPVTFEGPRGRYRPRPDADWHLLAGDETSLPAIATILDALPPDAPVWTVVETADASEHQDLPREVQWLDRNGEPAGQSRLLVDAVTGLALPAGVGQAWVAAESALTREIRDHLVSARGMASPMIHAAGYWKLGEPSYRDHAAG